MANVRETLFVLALGLDFGWAQYTYYPASADDWLTTSLVAPGTDYPRSIVIADVNFDGHPDLVTATHGSANAVFYYENDGSGSFTGYTVGSCITGNYATTADLNGDGKMDIIASEYNTGPVWYENSGGSGSSITWTKRTVSSASAYAWWVDGADLNNDGHIDVIAGYRGSNVAGVRIFLNDGDGASWTQNFVSLTSFDNVQSTTTADINGDGWMDVVAASQTDGVKYWAVRTWSDVMYLARDVWRGGGG